MDGKQSPSMHHTNQQKHAGLRGHPHSPHLPDGTADIKMAFFLNLSFTVIELVGGILTNSTAIIADAIHDMGDSIALGQAWYFESLTKTPGSSRYTYGYRRFTLLGALISIVILLLSSVYVLTEAIPRLIAPEPANAQGMLLLAILGVAVNGFAALRLSANKGVNAQVVTLHLLEDALGWVAILVVATVLLFKDIPILDPILAILITLYILYGVIKNLKKTVDLLLQATPEELDVERLNTELQELNLVKRVHHTHVWSLDGERHVLTAHLVTEHPLTALEYKDVKQTAGEIVARYGFFHSTIELEWPEEACRIGANHCH